MQSKADLDSIRPFVKNIILDFGGVLFDIDYKKPIQEFRKLGIPNFEKLYQKSNQSDLFDKLEIGALSQIEFIEEIKSITNVGLSSEEILFAWNSILIGIDKKQIQRVSDLKKTHRMFLLSNTNEIHVKAFEKTIDQEMGLDFFRASLEQIYYSNEINSRKPNPSTFLKVCKWNNLKVEETLFVDDSIQHVKGAVEAGLIGFHLDLKETNFLEIFKDW